MLFAQRTNQIPHFHNLLRIQPDRRLVKNQNRGVADKSLRNAHSLLVALGQIPDEPFPHMRNAGDFTDFRQMLVPLQGGVFQVINEIQIFLHGHVHIQRGLFRQKTDLLLCFQRILQNVHTVDFRFAGTAGKVSAENVHGGGFTGTVRTQKANDFAVVNFKTDVVYRFDPAILLCEMLNFDHTDVFFLSDCRMGPIRPVKPIVPSFHEQIKMFCRFFVSFCRRTTDGFRKEKIACFS